MRSSTRHQTFISRAPHAGDSLLLMRLRVIVEFDQEAQRWSAVFPELPGCASAGDTEDEALANAKDALALWFEPSDVLVPEGAKVLEVALP